MIGLALPGANIRLSGLALISSLALTACGFFSADKLAPPGPSVAETLNSLPAAPVFSPEPLVPDRDQLISLYRFVAENGTNSQQKYEVSKRLVNLEIQATEEASMSGEVSYAAIIDRLNTIIELPEASSDAASLTYQLARAQDQQGLQSDLETSLSRIINANTSTGAVVENDVLQEAYFRRAELRFSKDDYKGAQSDYRLVASSAGKYQLHAAYMLSWANFKMGDLDASLDASVNAFKLMAASEPSGHKELNADLLRVTVIALDYLDGPETLSTLMAAASKPAWQTQIYRALGDWYLTKQRFEDSARTWRRFLLENPLNPDAPQIALQVIDTYRLAGFSSQINQMQQDFVRQYDKQSKFYQMHGDPVFASYQTVLRGFLEAEIRRLHASAQKSHQATEYVLAAAGYDRWLTNFAGEVGSDQMLFLQAEARADSGQPARAVLSYERLLADYPDSQYAREAAYGVVLLYEVMAEDEDMSDPLISERIAANVRFAETFPLDSRAAPAALKASTLAYQSGQYALAARLAETVISSPSGSDEDLYRVALTTSAHSYFALGAYDKAAAGYRKQLAHFGPTPQIEERLLATVFKQAEIAEAAGEIEQAIGFYQALSEIDDKADVSIAAEYDIALLFENMGDLARATSQLEAFRHKHPRHRLSAEIPPRLVALFESQQRYNEAASVLIEIVSHTQDDEVKRQAQYRAAELYLQANNTEMAIDSFRHYAHEYEMPASLRFEAMTHLDSLYLAAGETKKREYWLKKKLKTFQTLPVTDQTDRIKFLAADAALYLADQVLEDFEAYKLGLPLKKSLKRKRKLMQAALDAYAITEAVGVYEFVTAANHRTGRVYQHLARSLIDSARPNGLNALELAQYEILLEEQAFPFEEQAIAIYQRNLQLGWQQRWNSWIDESLQSLAILSPGRYERQEMEVAYAEVLY